MLHFCWLFLYSLVLSGYGPMGRLQLFHRIFLLSALMEFLLTFTVVFAYINIIVVIMLSLTQLLSALTPLLSAETF